MTVSTLRPDGTTSSTWTVTGAGSAHAALSDNSDASYLSATGTKTGLFTVGDLSLPAGAIIAALAARVRSALGSGTPAFVGSNIALGDGTSLNGPQQTTVTWATPTTVTVTRASRGGISDAAVDGASLSLFGGGQGGGPELRIYELYLDVTYVERPTLTADAPSGTITTTNIPPISWTGTFDSDGGAQTYFQVKLFTDAEYLATGFDPELTASTVGTSGIAAGADSSWQPTATLPDDTYRAYVRVAQTVNGGFSASAAGQATPAGLHWSDWSHAEFTIDVDLPAAPLLFVTDDPSYGRNDLTITEQAGVAPTDLFELERSVDGGATWTPMRTLDAGQVVVPYVASTSTYSDAADSTTHVVTLPVPGGGIQANDILIAFSAMDGGDTTSWPADWRELLDTTANSAANISVAWKRCVGGESGTVTLTTSSSQGGGVRVLLIRGAHRTSSPEISATINAITANADPGPCTPSWAGNAENTIYIAAAGNDGNVAITAGPSGYLEFGNTRWANAAGAGIATAYIRDSGFGVDPGPFTNSAEDTLAFTVAVRPFDFATIAYDYDAPNGVAVTYRVRAVHNYNGALAPTAWVTSSATAWTSSSWWLKHPSRPELNTAIAVQTVPTWSRSGRLGVLQALGSSTAIAVQDKRGPKTGQLAIRVYDAASQGRIDALLDTGDTLLLHPPTNGGPPMYVRVGDHSRTPIRGQITADESWEALALTEVEAPVGDLVSWS